MPSHSGTLLAMYLLALAMATSEISIPSTPAKRESVRAADATTAIKLLLAEELEKNHWTLVSMFRVLDDLKEATQEYPQATFRLHIALNGSEHFRMKKEPGDETETGSWIPKFHTALYEKMLPSLAELDQTLFETVSATYSEVAELNHYREPMTSFLAGESLAPDPGMTQRFLSNFASKKDDYYILLNTGYKALTGEDLEKKRLR